MLLRDFITPYLFEAAYDPMVAALKKQFSNNIPWIDDHVKWAKQSLKKSDRVTWYLRILKSYLENSGDVDKKLLGNFNFFQNGLTGLQNSILHFYGFNSPKIENYKFESQTVSQVIIDLTKLEQEFQSEQEKNKPVPVQEGDYELINFADGYAWWWVDRAYCPEEGRSGGHCGNVVGQQKKDQRILSFRTPKGQVLLTFILESNGALGEMKAKNNQKPQEKFHPYIVKLLDLDIVKGIESGGYAPHMNFSMFDLKEDQLLYFYKKKPKLVEDQVAATPVELLKAPEKLKQDSTLQSIAVKKRPGLQILFGSEVNNASWERALARDPELIIHAPPTIDNFENRVVELFDSYYSEDAEQLIMSAPPHISKNPALLTRIVSVSPTTILAISPTVKNYKELAVISVSKSRSVRDTVEANMNDSPAELVNALKEYESNREKVNKFRGPNRDLEIEKILLQTQWSDESYFYVMKLSRDSKSQLPETLVENAIRYDDRALEIVNLLDIDPKRRDRLYELGIELYGYSAYKVIKKPSPELQKKIAYDDPSLISYFDDPAEDAVMIAIDTYEGQQQIPALIYKGHFPSDSVFDALYDQLSEYSVDEIIKMYEDTDVFDDITEFNYDIMVKRFKEYAEQLVKRFNRDIKGLREYCNNIKEEIKKLRDTNARYKESLSDPNYDEKIKKILNDGIKENNSQIINYKNLMFDQFDRIKIYIERIRRLKAALAN